jgi:uncharacterized protein (DUF1778 family)
MLSYATPSHPPRLKTIRQLASFEANLAAAKLDAAGVTCFVIDDHISTAYPLVFASVRLQVPEDEVERAEAILTEPAADTAGLEHHQGIWETRSVAEGEAEGEAEDEAGGDYVEESFRCPRCHRKDVELMPLPAMMRVARLVCVMMLLLSVLAGGWMFAWQGGDPDLFAPGPAFGWLVALGILSFIVLTAKRRKRCRACGQEWQG